MAIFDKVSIDNVKAYWANKKRTPYLGETLFPADKKLGLKLEWVKGYNEAAPVLMPASFDESVQLRDRNSASIETTRMPFFREGIRLGEEDRQQLLMFADTQPMYAESIARRVMEDNANMIESALVVPEIMRMGLLQDGKFKIEATAQNGKVACYEIDYGATAWDATNKVTLTGTAAWSDETNADPIKDIQEIVLKAAENGVELKRAIVGLATWRHLLNNAKIKAAFKDVPYVSQENVKNYIYNLCGVEFLVYTKLYKGLDGLNHNFFAQDGIAVFMPEADLGKTWYGTAPHEADAMNGQAGTNVDVQVINEGVCIFTKTEAAPVNMLFGAEEIVCPSFEAMNSVFRLTW